MTTITINGIPYRFQVTGGRLDVSPRGSYVTQTPDVLLRADGSQISLPQSLRDARDFAWSPDERWLVVAGRYALTVLDVASLERYDANGSGPRSVTLPQAAARVAWRQASAPSTQERHDRLTDRICRRRGCHRLASTSLSQSCRTSRCPTCLHSDHTRRGCHRLGTAA